MSEAELKAVQEDSYNRTDKRTEKNLQCSECESLTSTDDDQILKCDGWDSSGQQCLRATHMGCCKPALANVPTCNWLCDVCAPNAAIKSDLSVDGASGSGRSTGSGGGSRRSSLPPHLPMAANPLLTQTAPGPMDAKPEPEDEDETRTLMPPPSAPPSPPADASSHGRSFASCLMHQMTRFLCIFTSFTGVLAGSAGQTYVPVHRRANNPRYQPPPNANRQQQNAAVANWRADGGPMAEGGFHRAFPQNRRGGGNRSGGQQQADDEGGGGQQQADDEGGGGGGGGLRLVARAGDGAGLDSDPEEDEGNDGDAADADGDGRAEAAEASHRRLPLTEAGDVGHTSAGGRFGELTPQRLMGQKHVRRGLGTARPGYDPIAAGDVEFWWPTTGRPTGAEPMKRVLYQYVNAQGVDKTYPLGAPGRALDLTAKIGWLAASKSTAYMEYQVAMIEDTTRARCLAQSLGLARGVPLVGEDCTNGAARRATGCAWKAGAEKTRCEALKYATLYVLYYSTMVYAYLLGCSVGTHYDGRDDEPEWLGTRYLGRMANLSPSHRTAVAESTRGHQSQTITPEIHHRWKLRPCRDLSHNVWAQLAHFSTQLTLEEQMEVGAGGGTVKYVGS